MQYSNHFWGYKLTFADWFKFKLIEELTYEIDVWLQEKFLTNDAQCLIYKSHLKGHIFGWVIWLFVGSDTSILLLIGSLRTIWQQWV
jgi:hypothetical protein